MGGKLGECINCREYDMGMYTMDVCRGWYGDKFNFSVEICESCLDKITKKWSLGNGSRTADMVFVFSRKETGLALDKQEEKGL